jgi:protein SCO1
MKIWRSFAVVAFVHACVWASALQAKDFPGESVFHLKGSWLDTQSKETNLSDLHGKILAVAMVYTSCRFSCPLIIEELNKIKSKISPEYLAKVNFVLLSMDPARDTPEALRRFAVKRNLDLSFWRVLTAKNQKTVREFSAVTGGNFKKTGEEFAHSNLISVISPDGVIEFSKPNLGQQIPEAAAAVNRLAAKTASP